MRFSYYYSIDNIVFDLNKYNDLDVYSNQYDNISNLNCAVIFIFMFNVINHVSYISPEFRIIAKSLSKYIRKVVVYSVIFTILFGAASLFIAYFIFGTYAIPYYKNLDFMFVNILTAIFRGSMDKIDFDPMTDRHSGEVNGFAK
jgi:hypothetical protein